MSQSGAFDGSDEQEALLAALRAVLAPLAALAVQRGLPYAAVDELLRRAFIGAADTAHPGLLAHRKVSRLSTSTGINRREVTRLLAALRDVDTAQVPGRTLAGELFARWVGDARYRDKHGAPRVLRRQGRAPSFESLARSITRDVHPRSLLDELVRLQIAAVDRQRDTVALLRDAFVPRGDRVRMLQFLGDNVGDHAAAAVVNVLGDGSRHFEQSVFADGLSEASVQEVWQHIGELWKGLLGALVPALEAKVERDGKPHGTGHRLRLGLYTFDEDTEATVRKPAPRKTRKKR
jgi:hypothetical protein